MITAKVCSGKYVLRARCVQPDIVVDRIPAAVSPRTYPVCSRYLCFISPLYFRIGSAGRSGTIPGARTTLILDRTPLYSQTASYKVRRWSDRQPAAPIAPHHTRTLPSRACAYCANCDIFTWFYAAVVPQGWAEYSAVCCAAPPPSPIPGRRQSSSVLYREMMLLCYRIAGGNEFRLLEVTFRGAGYKISGLW